MQDPETMRAPALPPASNAQKAKALLAMLEGQPAVGGLPEDRLRDWARDLVDTVERRNRAAPDAEADRREEQKHAPLAGARPKEAAGPRLFSRPAPTLTRPKAVPAPARPEPQPQTKPRSAPLSLLPADLASPRARTCDSPALLPIASLRRMVEAAISPETMRQEHPALVALSLAGRPSIEQAQALRALPGPKARAVHRGLRQLEGSAGGAPRPVSA